MKHFGNLENKIREKEKEKSLIKNLIFLARMVYLKNDERAIAEDKYKFNILKLLKKIL